MIKVLRILAFAVLLAGAVSARAQPEDAPQEEPQEEPQEQRAPAAPEVANLRPRFVEGQSARYSLWTVRNQSISMRIGDRDQTLSTRMEVNGEMQWQVERVEVGGGATCVMTMHWMSAAMTLPDGNVQTVDTRRGPSEPQRMHQLMSAMVGVPLRVEVSADGSVSSVQGLDAMRQRVPEDLTLPEELDFIESASELAVIPFAPESLPVGDSWPSRFTWTHEAGKMHYDTQSTLQSIEMIAGIPVATVTSRSQMSLEPDMSQFPRDGPAVEIRMLSGDARSQVMFDLTRREAVGRNSIETRRIEVRIQLPDQTAVRTTDETVQTQALRIDEQ